MVMKTIRELATELDCLDALDRRGEALVRKAYELVRGTPQDEYRLFALMQILGRDAVRLEPLLVAMEAEKNLHENMVSTVMIIGLELGKAQEPPPIQFVVDRDPLLPKETRVYLDHEFPPRNRRVDGKAVTEEEALAAARRKYGRPFPFEIPITRMRESVPACIPVSLLKKQRRRKQPCAK